MTTLSLFIRGESLVVRVLRTAVFTFFGFGASQVVRLLSNLILTRLLYPEAFGMMALVTVAMVALANFSDMGTGPAIAQSRRGDDPDFLDTAWTLHVIRGFVLWICACILAWPFSRFFGEPMLLHLLPVAAFTTVIAGFTPTRIETAHRHLLVGRVTVLEFITQVTSIAAMVALAAATRSIWALVAGALVGAVVHLVLVHVMLPGHSNRFRLEPEAKAELLRFGRWIFISTICGFIVGQGDKVVLGRYLDLGTLGIYNLGYFLASFPMLLGGALVGRLVIPIYRERPPSESPENFLKLRQMRFVMTGGVVALLLAMAFLGMPLVRILYDERFHDAGPMVVLIAVMQIPQAITMTYDFAALAAGNSRRFFFFIAPKAVLLLGVLLAGVHFGGLIGALVGQGVAGLVAYPMAVSLARRFGAWDPLHDAVFFIAGAVIGGAAISMNLGAILALG